MDLLLHRLSWSVQVPARQAAERDEEQITAWREQTWPSERNGGGLGRLAGSRGRIGPEAEAAEGAHLGPPPWIFRDLDQTARLALADTLASLHLEGATP